jgi:Fe-S-cluster containining protein
MPAPEKETPWYRDGLRFECTRCGNCCSGPPGTVFATEAEAVALAEHLGIANTSFREKYVRLLVHGGVLLREKPNSECIFFNGAKGCSVYEHRPLQCRSWPFWRSTTLSPERWLAQAESCPGMNRGPLFDSEFIRRTGENDGTPAAHGLEPRR